MGALDAVLQRYVSTGPRGAERRTLDQIHDSLRLTLLRSIGVQLPLPTAGPAPRPANDGDRHDSGDRHDD